MTDRPIPARAERLHYQRRRSPVVKRATGILTVVSALYIGMVFIGGFTREGLLSALAFGIVWAVAMYSIGVSYQAGWADREAGDHD